MWSQPAGDHATDQHVYFDNYTIFDDAINHVMYLINQLLEAHWR